MIRVLGLLLLSLPGLSFGAPEAKAPPPKALPWLGPGLDKLSPAEYERIYKNYIQTSILLGYPMARGMPEACSAAVNALFRQAGLFSYPVPGEASQIRKSVRRAGASSVETYELGGTLLQLQKNAANDSPERLFWINSGSPKATRRLADIARKELLTLEQDKITGLERVKGIPVGYPHLLLGNEGQGLQVRLLKFNGKKDGCEPTDFTDNAWSGGFDLDETRCESVQDDVQRVWRKELSTEQFAARELVRMKDAAVKEAVARGTKPEEARKIVEKHFAPPFAAEVNVVGSAMRNLAQCNLLALGRASGVKKTAPPPAAPVEGGASMDPGSRSAH